MKSFWKLGLAALAPVMLAGQASAQQDSNESNKTITVVVNAQSSDVDDLLGRVRAQLEKSGIPEENRDKILAQVRESIEKASKAKHELSQATQSAVEAGKAAAEAVKETATIVIHADGHGAGQRSTDGKSMRVQGFNLADVQKHLPHAIRGRVLQQIGEGGPSYRIGISLNQRISDEDESDDADEGDDKDDGDDEENADEVGLEVEEVLDDSPAREAGIHAGDIIVSVNGKRVKVFTDIQQEVQESGKNEKPVVLELKRAGKEMKVKVVPTKTEASDIGITELELLPQNAFIGRGFVFGEKGQPGAEWKVNPPNGAAWTISGGDDSLKKEVQELKGEIAELKALIKKLLDK